MRLIPATGAPAYGSEGDPSRAPHPEDATMSKPNPRVAAALAHLLRKACKEAKPQERSRVKRTLPPFSATTYLILAARNKAVRRLDENAAWLLSLLAVRADDRGRLRFPRVDLMRLYGIEPGDIDDTPFQRALDRLIEQGFVRRETRAGYSNLYALALPRSADALPLQADLRVPREAHVAPIQVRATTRGGAADGSAVARRELAAGTSSLDATGTIHNMATARRNVLSTRMAVLVSARSAFDRRTYSSAARFYDTHDRCDDVLSGDCRLNEAGVDGELKGASTSWNTLHTFADSSRGKGVDGVEQRGSAYRKCAPTSRALGDQFATFYTFHTQYFDKYLELVLSSSLRS